MGERPDQAGEHQDEWCIVADELIDQSRYRQLGLLRGEDEFAHLAERRVATGAGDFHFDDPRNIGRAGEDLLAHRAIHWERLAGQVGLVDGGVAD